MRSVMALLYRKQSISRVPRKVTTQIAPIVCPQRGFSSVPRRNLSSGPGSASKPPELGGNFSKGLIVSVAIGTCFAAAYSTGYLDDILGKKQKSSTDPLEVRADYLGTEKLPQGGDSLHDSEDIKESIPLHSDIHSNSPSPLVEDSKESAEEHSLKDASQNEVESDFSGEKSSDLKPDEYKHVREEESPKSIDEMHAKREELPKSSHIKKSTEGENPSDQKFEDSVNKKALEQKTSFKQHKSEENLPTGNGSSAMLRGNQTNKDYSVELKSKDEAKEPSTSLLDAYSMRDKSDESTSTSSDHLAKRSSPREEITLGAFGDLSDAYVSKDGKLIVDFLQAIHAAEKRQAELDARIFAKEKMAIKEKYEKELKDARARELMYAEEVAMLEKEVKKERAKAAAALKSLQERLEEKLKMELEQKDKEAESKLKELEEFAKAELAASIAKEKAAQLEKMAEADLNINALCMAFYARSEEARQTHSIHKLALGALALEDALSNGLPVQRELDALNLHIEGADKDSLLELALSSLPEDVRFHGTDSLLQLHQKFDALKGTLRHFSLIPPNGGGILAHSLAHVASFLKVKEADQSGDGIESLINKVESLLAKGKLVEAANTLEDGVQGSKAAEAVVDWLRRARNRAIAEQAYVLLQSYATSVSLA